MTEHECPTNQPDSAANPGAATAASRPTLPLEQRRVQWTLGFLALLAALALLWSGRDVLWRDQIPADGPRSTDVLLQIDINSAEAREFAVLPGVGPILAARIVADRELHGPFESIQDLSRVHGIGQKKIEQIDVYCVVQSSPDSLVAFSDDPVK